MAITFVATDTPGSRTTGTSHSQSVPAHAVGDLIVIWMASDGGSETLTASGTETWNHLTAIDEGTVTGRLAWTIATGTSGFTATVSGGSAEAAWSSVAVFRGTDSSPFGVSNTATGTSDQPAVTQTTGTTSNSWAIAVMGMDRNSVVSDSGYPTNTTGVHSGRSGNGANDSGGSIAYDTTGAIDSESYTWGVQDRSDGYVAGIYEIKEDSLDIQSGAGTSIPSLTTTGVGAPRFAGDGTSSPSLTTTGVGISTNEADGTSSPSLTTTGVGTAIKDTVGTSAPSLTTGGDGATIVAGDGTSSPSLSTSGAGSPIFSGDGTSTPALTTTGVGISTAAGDGASTPSLTSSGVGISTHKADGTSSPSLTTAGVGTAVKDTVGTSAPSLTTAGVGESSTIQSGAGTSTSSLTTTGVGAPRFAGVGTSSPSLTTTATGIALRDGVGSSTPTLSSLGVGSAVFVSTGTSASSLSSTALGATVLSAVGLSDAVLISIGVSELIGEAGIGTSTLSLAVNGRGSVAFIQGEHVIFSSVEEEGIDFSTILRR